MRYILALALACACAFGQPRQNSTYIKVVPFGSDPAGNSCTTEGAGALGVYSSGVRVCNGTTWAAVSGGTQIGGYFTSTTGSDTYVMTTSNVATLTNGVYVFTASTSNTGGAQLDWDGVGGASAVPILTEFGSTLVDGMISTTSPNLLYYNGTNFLLMFSSRVIPNATGYQWGRMYSNDGIFWTATFLEGAPSTGPTSITSASNSIDPAGRGGPDEQYRAHVDAFHRGRHVRRAAPHDQQHIGFVHSRHQGWLLIRHLPRGGPDYRCGWWRTSAAVDPGESLLGV
jgi:hypothetical protein